ncbi:kinase-like domain-containing protein [Mycena belliarum]|uniref:Kinase-like domain-containing protein n=1 Tax=Mycena belliarum TaxID=1033014 RepID=A0AAD6U4Y1_9AGAR|nr:kinase-like domain-containing protein [Mycena belliae]
MNHPEETLPPIGTRPVERGLRERPHERLLSAEVYWYNHRDWLHAKGYALRARYQEGWTASWTHTKHVLPSDFEDGVTHLRGNVMDATRIRDGVFVMLKCTSKRQHPSEVEIASFFSAEPQRSDPRNHCVPIYEVLQTPDNPDKHIVVMPLLTRYSKPRFDTIGEAVSFFKQIFEALKYMHAQNVAHRDCTARNIMMDAAPIFTVPFHPVKPRMKRDFSGRSSPLSRTQHPVRYYLTDFGLSVKYGSEDRPPLEIPVNGADKSVPEFQSAEPPAGDPFPVDVYYLGNLIRMDFTEVRKLGFEFMEPLVADMVNTDPALRPTMVEVVDRFEEIVRGLSNWKLRSRVAKTRDSFTTFRSIAHWIRRVRLIVGRYHPIPMP